MYYLTQEQINLISPYFPASRGVTRQDDRRIISGIIHVLKRGLQWRDAPPEYGPHKTLYNRFVRWSEKGIFQKIFMELVTMEDIPEQLQIDATHIKAHRTAASLAKRGSTSCHRTHKRRLKLKTLCGHRWSWTPCYFDSDGRKRQ